MVIMQRQVSIPFLRLINTLFINLMRRILQLHQTGLLVYWQKKYLADDKKCMYGDPNYYELVKQNELVPISMIHLFGNFVLLGYGCVISLLVFTGEHLAKKRNNRLQQQ